LTVKVQIPKAKYLLSKLKNKEENKMSSTAKSDYIWLNGEMVPWADAKVHVMSHALHYGTSVFEGVRCYNTHKGPAIFRHKEHAQRLLNSAKIYRFPVSYSLEEIMEATRQTIKKNKLESAYIRPLVFIGDVGMGVNPPEGYKTDVMIAAFPWGAYLGEEALDQGIDAMVSSWNRVASNTIPAAAKAGGNYLSSLLIGSEARANGFQEGIALDVHGHLSEGAGENLFIIKDGILYTPVLSSSALPGITRDAVLTLARDIGIEVREQTLSRESLYLADEVFMTGTAAEITPVRSVDRIQVGIGRCGPITKQIQQAFFGLFNGKTEDKYGWLDLIK
jgi:branched-chain amino acid aminotransferase